MQEALDFHLNGQNPSTHAIVYQLLAQCYLADQRIAMARGAIDRALAVPNQTFSTRMAIATTAARAYELRSPSDAIRQLQSVVDQTTRNGFVVLALEARLHAAEIEIRSGERASGRAHLKGLQSEAAHKGFVLMARKARAALEASTHVAAVSYARRR